MLKIDKYTIGVGDRFAHQGKAQLAALMAAKDLGVEVAPVWNKSHREHTTIGTNPGSVREEADAAVAALGYTGSYYVDADHIGLKNVDHFMDASTFFTLDVADFIGEEADAASIEAFVAKYESCIGELSIPGIDESFRIDREMLTAIGKKYVLAVQEAKKIYDRVETVKGAGTFITEVSMDETDIPQTPVEMYFILAMVADAGIPAQTIAPRFSGRFNKGVDYVGDVAQFTTEFEQDLAVIAHAIKTFGMAETLKLSVHSGSDKFSIYGPIGNALRKTGAGLHLKTAGTTWLEELIGLALAGGEGLAIAKEVYRSAFGRYDELAAPYASVIDIDRDRLPSPDEVDGWEGEAYAGALRHDPNCESYNLHFRQLLHVGYKVAAEMGGRYLDALKANEEVVASNVKENLLERHIKKLFTV